MVTHASAKTKTAKTAKLSATKLAAYYSYDDDLAADVVDGLDDQMTDLVAALSFYSRHQAARMIQQAMQYV